MRAGERQIPIGSLVAGAGALLLAVSLFLHWYDDLTAFSVFEVLDLVLLGLAIASLLAAAEGVGLRPLGGASLGGPRSIVLGAVALVIVLSQAVNEPPAIVHTDEGPELGLWLGLAGAALIVAGALLGTARVSLALDVERGGRAIGDEPTVASPAARPSAGPDDPTISELPPEEPRT
ncbi:MAG: hypothetical protein ABR581_10445 [Thermoleophilaceae bacterium]